MKILKAKVYVDQSGGKTTYIYPQVWLDNKEKFPAIMYPNDRTDQGTDEGGTYQWVYPVVPDDLAATLLALPEFSAPTRADVQAYADKHWPAVETILDSTKVLTVVAKILRQEALTLDERKALDPADPTPGVNRTVDFLKRAETDYGAII